MRRSIMMLLSASLISQATLASPCDDALSKADIVIEKQQKLIEATQDKLVRCYSETDGLDQQMASMRELYESERQKKLVYGAVGTAFGIALTLLIRGAK